MERIGLGFGKCMNRRARTIAPFVLMLAFVACTPTTPGTPNTPTPPQVKLTQDVAVLRSGLPVALTALQAARSGGSLSPADVTSAENKILVPLALTGKAIDAEVLTGDDWATMKAKVLAIISKAGLAGAAANLPAKAQIVLAAVVAAYNSIAVSVGGPTL